MRLLEQQDKIEVTSELEAKELIEAARTKAASDGYTLKKAGYEYKTKTKGGNTYETWVVTIVKIFGKLWEDLE